MTEVAVAAAPEQSAKRMGWGLLVLALASPALMEAIGVLSGYKVGELTQVSIEAGDVHIEQGFGWAKAVGNIRQVMVRGIEKVDQLFVLRMAAYNLTRTRTLGQIRAQGR